jgi:hypothetical protein
MTLLAHATAEQRIAVLEEELAELKQKLFEESARKQLHRRRLRTTSLVVSLVCCIACALHASADSYAFAPTVSSSTVAFPPLDSFVTWARRDASSDTANHTTEILSLIGEGNKRTSYLWPLYIELRGTSDNGATMKSSQSVGATVRALVRSTGTPWTAGFHSEIAHGNDSLDGPNAIPTNGTSILMNGEMRSYSSGGETIGVNLQCVYTNSHSKNCNHAINIQAGSATTVWQNGLHFDSSGSYITGNVGINFDQAHYKLGLDLADNSLRLNANQKIFLDRSGTVFVWYNSTSGKIEFVRHGSVVASF